MKHQAILIKSTKCFYLYGGSSIKCFNNGIDKLQYPNMGIPNFYNVETMGTYETRNGMERNQLGRALVKIAVSKFTSLFSIVLPYLMVFLH